MKVSPASLAVPPGSSFSVSIVQNANFVTTGAGADFSFDPALLQVTAVERTPAYKKASLIYGVAPQTLDQAIAEANSTGKLVSVTAFFIPGAGSVPAGETSFVKITMKAGAPEGVSPITLSRPEMLNEAGESLVVAATNGAVTVDKDAPPPVSLGAESGPSALPSTGGGLAGRGAESILSLLVAAGLMAAGAVTLWRARRRSS